MRLFVILTISRGETKLFKKMVDSLKHPSGAGKIPRSNPPGSKILIRWIFGGLTVWGIAQAIGAYSSIMTQGVH